MSILLYAIIRKKSRFFKKKNKIIGELYFMEELLDVVRNNYTVARWFVDDKSGYTIEVSAEVSEPRFKRFVELRNGIVQQQANIKMQYIFIGMALKEIRDTELYRYVTRTGGGGVGYRTFTEFSKDVFGLTKDTASRMVSVAENYCGEDGGLKLPYLNFSYSQLIEMLNMEEKQRLRIPATLPVRQIRALKTYYNNNAPKETIEKDLEDYERQCREERERKNAKRNSLQFIPAKKPSEETVATSQLNDEPDFDGEDERDVITPNIQKPSFDAVREGLYMQLSLLRQSWEGKGKAAYDRWSAFCEHVETALKARFPDYIVPYNEKKGEEPSEVTFEYLRDKIKEDFECMKELDPNWLHMAKFVCEGLEKKDYVYITKREFLDKARKDLATKAIELQKLLDGQKERADEGTKGVPARGKLSLKNKKEREEWLKNFRSWGVWLSVPEVSKTFYRYDFENGSSLIVELSLEYNRYSATLVENNFLRYAIVDEKHPKYDSAYQGGASGIVEWLSKHSKEI